LAGTNVIVDEDGAGARFRAEARTKMFEARMAESFVLGFIYNYIGGQMRISLKNKYKQTGNFECVALY
jgi:hypothetical protein